MHISYRHDEPEVIVSHDNELALLMEALKDLRVAKLVAREKLNSVVLTGGRQFTQQDFGIPTIDAMLQTLGEVTC